MFKHTPWISALSLALTPVLAFAQEAHEAAAEAGAHEGAGGGLLNPDLGTAVWTLVLFIVLLAVLGKFVWPNIVSGLDAREHKIREDIHSAEKANQQAQKTLAEYKQSLADAHAEARKMIDQARVDADAVRAKLVADAEAEAAKLRERSRQEIMQAKQQAVSDLYAQAGEIAVAVAGKILHRQINASDTQSLVDESLSELSKTGL
ncbi:MAG: F0F1 ATP synthase subunit B [Planctomycetes bacterium]|nr:F0F1 ATP synthase subunit B [Planctomycetota bacterium]